MDKIMNPSNVMQNMKGSWGDYRPIPQRFSEAEIAGALDLIRNAKRYPSHVHEFMLKEAITTTKFPNLFGAIVDRELLARYKFAKPDWESYVLTGTVSNFNEHTRDRLLGIVDQLPKVGEKGEYLVSSVAECQKTRQVFKRGRQFDISWEALVNDGMDAFADIPQRYADAAINTEAQLVTELYASSGGPDTSLYGDTISDCGQDLTNEGTLALTIANLETTLELMAAQEDPNGNPLGIIGVHLVVPPALKFTARQILESAGKMWTDIGSAVPMPTANVLAGEGINLHVNPWLPIVDTTDANTTWYVFADLAQGAAIGFDRLKGHESPEIVMKASNKASVTGAPISPFDGDFESDNVFYRARIACGGNRIDPRMTYAQVG